MIYRHQSIGTASTRLSSLISQFFNNKARSVRILSVSLNAFIRDTSFKKLKPFRFGVVDMASLVHTIILA